MSDAGKPAGRRLPAQGRQPAGRAGRQEGPHHHHRQRRDPRLDGAVASASSRTRSPASCATPGSAPSKTGDFYGQCAELCGKEHAYMPIHVKVLSAGRLHRLGRRQEEGNGRARPTTRTRSGSSPTWSRAARRSTPPTARPATRPTARAPARSSRSTARRSCSTPTRPSRSTVLLNGQNNGAMPAWKQLSRHRDRRRRSPTPRTTGPTRPGRSCSRPKSSPRASRLARHRRGSGIRMSAVIDHHGHGAATTPTTTTTTPRRAARLAPLAVRDQPQGHRHDVPVVLVHDVDGRRRAGAADPRRAVPARACSSSTRSCSTSSPRCTA